MTPPRRHGPGLEPDDLDPDPLRQFQLWLDAAVAADVPEPTAMALATAGPDGQPSARMVLLKQVDTGFVFYTNYRSRKARQLEANPAAAVTFYWAQLDRQVTAAGAVARVSQAESDAYFATRPLGSQLAAWASPQSEPLADRARLDALVEQVRVRFGDRDVPRPAHWGGYRLVPDVVEFWQARDNRLHDRVCYRRDGDAWRRTRLAP